MPGLEVFISPPACLVETPGEDVGLDLSVPMISQELLEPAREPVEILGW